MFVEKPVSSASFQQTGLMAQTTISSFIVIIYIEEQNWWLSVWTVQPEREVLGEIFLFLFLCSYAMLTTALFSQALLFLLGTSQ